ncbi:MAG: hypothetical protein HFF12_05060 [Angelakisella sp.]|nr:hypothetical protein [Angelakisella sp.]
MRKKKKKQKEERQRFLQDGWEAKANVLRQWDVFHPKIFFGKEEKEAKRRTAKVLERRMGSKSQCFTPVGCFSS